MLVPTLHSPYIPERTVYLLYAYMAIILFYLYTLLKQLIEYFSLKPATYVHTQYNVLDNSCS